MFENEFTIEASDLVLHIQKGCVTVYDLNGNGLSKSVASFKITTTEATALNCYPDERIFSFGDITLELISRAGHISYEFELRIMQLLNNYSIERRINYLIARNNSHPIEMIYEPSDAEKQFEQEQREYLEFASERLYGQPESSGLGSR